ncbi:MAG: hypothetical protein M1814_006100 [Vezdaea aestivalis]|nr:MAG: hypothetical protein M1814_006100 [Vezdaea aestivalis]
MKLFCLLFLVTVAVYSADASSWFSKAVYNKWHETELERWLSDHDIPYPTPADRKDLENLVKDNWQSKIATPYNQWETPDLQAYLKEKSVSVKKGSEKNKDSLIDSVKKNWYETEDAAGEAFQSVKGWIFDTWSDSQLKAFCDKHDIPVPQPRKRDSLLAVVRSNYDSVAKKIGQTNAYPGNWLYENWSDSDIKAWLDERGYPVPQPSTRDKLVASIRRNSRLAGLKASGLASTASASAAAAQSSLGDKLFDAWSDTQLKEFADKNGIKVPQGSKRNELLALVRKHRASLLNDNISGSAASAYGAATSKAGNEYAKATEDASYKAQHVFDSTVSTWSQSKLKSYLDARGVPVPQNGKKDELVALVRKNSHKAASGYTAWTFDTWTAENLKTWLESQGQKVSKSAASNRAELAKSASSAYTKASGAGNVQYASMTSALVSATASVKDASFDGWSDSELKAYLDSYGVPVYQGTKTNELKALAKKHYTYFRYGTSSPGGTLLAKLQNGAQWIFDQLRVGALAGKDKAVYEGQKGGDYVKEGAQTATNRGAEASLRAKDKIKEEL